MNDQEFQLLRGRILHVLGDVESLAEHVNTLMGCAPVERKPFPVLYLRRERGWSQARVVTELQRAASTCGHRLPDRKELQQLVSGWERGLAPNAFYRELLRMVFGRGSHHANKASA
ncbi:hypothetical protein ACFYTC_49065 [Actinomadura nitritigenes]|uniref:hypothetical protein n=1 Tax=Actinomadura nitritigenes TaxID=134602 RepID=UPI0036C7088D